VRRGVAELAERLRVDVVDRVARQVVARVIRLAGRAAVDGRLLRRLDPLGAREQATGRRSFPRLLVAMTFVVLAFGSASVEAVTVAITSPAAIAVASASPSAKDSPTTGSVKMSPSAT